MPQSKGQQLFLEQLAKSRLPSLLRPYDAISRVRAMLELQGHGIIAGAENFVAASANVESGATADMPRDVLLDAIRESDRLTLRVPPDRPPLIGYLRTIRGLRPAWFTSAIYADLLNPFKQQVQELTGFPPSEVFDLLSEISSMPAGAPAPIDRLRALPDSLLVDAKDIKEPAAFRDRAFIRVGDWIYALPYQMADATYRALCSELRKQIPRFLDRKGDSLERVVLSWLKQSGPNWSWIDRFSLSADPDHEHDAVGFRERYGIAIECKSLNLRPSSTDWSALNVAADIQPLVEALSQVDPVLGLLEAGGTVVNREGTRHVPRVSWARGLIVTDEIFTPYLRAFIDPLTSSGSLDLDPGTWHGSRVFVVSILDLVFLLRSSACFSTFVESCDWFSKRPRLRTVDTPEAWLLYCVDPTTRLTNEGAQTVAEYEELWEKIEGRSFTNLRPPWLSSYARVAEANDSGQVHRAVGIIKRDRARASRYFYRHGGFPNMSPFWSENTNLLRRDHWRVRVRTRDSPPLDN